VSGASHRRPLARLFITRGVISFVDFRSEKRIRRRVWINALIGFERLPVERYLGVEVRSILDGHFENVPKFPNEWPIAAPDPFSPAPSATGSGIDRWGKESSNWIESNNSATSESRTEFVKLNVSMEA
jgi:hypothetical protein